jgi:hypothetical protein
MVLIMHIHSITLSKAKIYLSSDFEALFLRAICQALLVYEPNNPFLVRHANYPFPIDHSIEIYIPAPCPQRNIS